MRIKLKRGEGACVEQDPKLSIGDVILNFLIELKRNLKIKQCCAGCRRLLSDEAKQSRDTHKSKINIKTYVIALALAKNLQ